MQKWVHSGGAEDLVDFEEVFVEIGWFLACEIEHVRDLLGLHEGAKVGLVIPVELARLHIPRHQSPAFIARLVL